MSHTLKDPKPDEIGLDILAIVHNADWSGEANIVWRIRVPAEHSEMRNFSVDGPSLVRGIIKVHHGGNDLSPRVANRAIALAVADRVARLIADALSSAVGQFK